MINLFSQVLKEIKYRTEKRVIPPPHWIKIYNLEKLGNE